MTVEEEATTTPDKNNDNDVPWDRATPRWEFRTCGRWDCKCKQSRHQRHGPYLTLYWKDKGKLKKKYLGRTLADSKDHDEFIIELGCKEVAEKTGMRHKQLMKFMRIVMEAKKGNKVAQEYQLKIEKKECTIDWAYKSVFIMPEKKLIQTRNEKLSVLAFKHGLDTANEYGYSASQFCYGLFGHLDRVCYLKTVMDIVETT
jgi:hypothetical protein